MVKDYGHDLTRLLLQTEQIAERLNLPTPEARLPQSGIHRGIIDTLSDFATNVTRYFNLDLVTGNPRASEREESGGSVGAQRYDSRLGTTLQASIPREAYAPEHVCSMPRPAPM